MTAGRTSQLGKGSPAHILNNMVNALFVFICLFMLGSVLDAVPCYSEHQARSGAAILPGCSLHVFGLSALLPWSSPAPPGFLGCMLRQQPMGLRPLLSSLLETIAVADSRSKIRVDTWVYVCAGERSDRLKKGEGGGLSVCGPITPAFSGLGV